MKRKDYTFEVCANSLDSCWAAQEGGADRVELCTALAEGGLTPSFGTIALAQMHFKIKVNVLIRPRGGDFLYSNSQGYTSAILSDISSLKPQKVNGIVVGALTEDADIDMRLMELVMEAAEGIPVTFHRAFDHCRRPFDALEDLVSLGVKRILTSGQQPTAYEGRYRLAKLVEAARGRLSIMPGCGINENNIAEIAHVTGAHEFHFSASEPVQSQMKLRNDEVKMGSADEYTQMETSEDRVRQIIKALCG